MPLTIYHQIRMLLFCHMAHLDLGPWWKTRRLRLMQRFLRILLSRSLINESREYFWILDALTYLEHKKNVPSIILKKKRTYSIASLISKIIRMLMSENYGAATEGWQTNIFFICVNSSIYVIYIFPAFISKSLILKVLKSFQRFEVLSFQGIWMSRCTDIHEGIQLW